jgi:murein DD-endopeptidase MepM/ murein hydrolase activator NlpD
MQNSFLFLVFLFITLTSFAQKGLKVYDEKTENGYVIYANNNEYCPVSVEFNFNLKNLKSSKNNQRIFVIPAQAKKFKVLELNIKEKNEAYGFNYNIAYNIGNHFLSENSKSFEYDLPFPTSKSYSIYQGYNGKFSHQNKNALDFDMPIGSKILAVRKGIIIKVVDKYNRSCPTSNCNRYNNFVTIYHEDGTFAEYTHIKYKGSAVKVGQKIEKGELIAYSGNVGWSTGPHLHLEIFTQNIKDRKTLPVKFRIDDGKKSVYLKEGTTYLRDY